MKLSQKSLRGTLLGCAAAAALFASGIAPASATFIIDPSPGGAKFFINGANHNVNTFTGLVGSNISGPGVTVNTTGNVDTGNGFATIKPSGGTLTDLIFTPDDSTLFSDFSFRAQLERAGFTGIVNVNVTDQSGTVFNLVFTGLAGPDADFGRIGVVSLDGETIKSVEILTPGGESFKEVKQIEFSGSSIPVPEPASLALFGAGLAGLGLLRRRRAI